MIVTSWYKTTPIIYKYEYKTYVSRRHLKFVNRRNWVTDINVASLTNYQSRYTCNFDVSNCTIDHRLDILEELAKMYSRNTWTYVLAMARKSQPVLKYKCTMALYHPLSSKLEWLSIPCSIKFNMSTIICQREKDTVKNKVLIHNCN